MSDEDDLRKRGLRRKLDWRSRSVAGARGAVLLAGELRPAGWLAVVQDRELRCRHGEAPVFRVREAWAIYRADRQLSCQLIGSARRYGQGAATRNRAEATVPISRTYCGHI